MIAREVVKPDQLEVIYTSQTFPTTGHGVAHNLTPGLQEKIKGAFFSLTGKAHSFCWNSASQSRRTRTASLDPKTSRQIMRRLIKTCAESGLPAFVNIHDMPLAQQFMQRIIGLRAGRVVFDGPPSDLTETVLTTICKAEDWTAKRKGSEDEAAAPLAPRRMAAIGA